MRGFRVAFLGLTAGAALALAATSASAGGYGDRGSVKDGPYAAPFSWTGFYLGAAVGVGIGTSEVDDGNQNQTDFSLQGAQGVLSAGYDFRVAPSVVLGVFTDYAFGEVDGDVGEANLSIDNQWAIGARLGVLAGPSTLWYGTAGWTRADFEISVPGDSTEEAVDGFFVGGGVEHALTRSLALKLEYRFSDYGDVTDDVLTGAEFDNTVHSVRLGVNWRFGGRDEHRAPLK